MTDTLVTHIIVLVAVIGFVAGLLIVLWKVPSPYKSANEKEYWRGRSDGYNACQDLSIKRAKESGYDMTKFMKDILQ